MFVEFRCQFIFFCLGIAKFAFLTRLFPGFRIEFQECIKFIAVPVSLSQDCCLVIVLTCSVQMALQRLCPLGHGEIFFYFFYPNPNLVEK